MEGWSEEEALAVALPVVAVRGLWSDDALLSKPWLRYNRGYGFVVRGGWVERNGEGGIRIGNSNSLVENCRINGTMKSPSTYGAVTISEFVRAIGIRGCQISGEIVPDPSSPATVFIQRLQSYSVEGCMSAGSGMFAGAAPIRLFFPVLGPGGVVVGRLTPSGPRRVHTTAECLE